VAHSVPKGSCAPRPEQDDTRAAEGNNRQENFSPLKSDGPHFSFAKILARLGVGIFKKSAD